MILTLQTLPDEILQQIILYLPPDAVTRLEQTCHKARNLTGSIVWRNLCKCHFNHWSPDRKLSQKLSSPLGEVDWRSIFIDRFKLDREVDQSFNDLLAQQRDRTCKIEYIASLGWDSKDALLRHAQCRDADDVLARQWYAKAVLGCLHRSIAISKWISLENRDTHDVTLESALAAFDLFVNLDPSDTGTDVSVILDGMKCDFLSQNNEFSSLSLTKKATTIAYYVRQHGFVGIEGDLDAKYHEMQNNFIGHALSQPPHSSLPLISVAIYCSLAQRLGVDARPCGFPFHVIAVIPISDGDAIFMDPFRSDDEIRQSDLLSQLVSMGAPSGDHQKLLQSAPTSEIVARCARNIIASIETMPRETDNFSDLLQPDVALYAALWVLLITARNRQEWLPQQATYLQIIIQTFQPRFKTDIWLMQKYFLPSFESFQPGVEDVLTRIRTGIDGAKLRKSRKVGSTDSVRYKVGQVFHHRRYHYHAIIIGWDVECEAAEQWIDQMRVHALPRGRYQSFYHVLVEDKSTRYVAEENIEITEQEPLPRLMDIAGEYFKRWEKSTRTFVSNIRDEYPDD